MVVQLVGQLVGQLVSAIGSIMELLYLCCCCCCCECVRYIDCYQLHFLIGQIANSMPELYIDTHIHTHEFTQSFIQLCVCVKVIGRLNYIDSNWYVNICSLPSSRAGWIEGKIETILLVGTLLQTRRGDKNWRERDNSNWRERGHKSATDSFNSNKNWRPNCA